MTDVKVITDRDTGKSRGFGFVTFEEADHASAALAEMNGTDLDGRTIRVDTASERKPRGGGGRGGRDGGDRW